MLRQSFLQCPTLEAKLRLLEVFEGISGRDMVQVRRQYQRVGVGVLTDRFKESYYKRFFLFLLCYTAYKLKLFFNFAQPF